MSLGPCESVDKPAPTNPKSKSLVDERKRSTQNLKSNDLRHFLKAKLPEYMIPSAFVMLETLPLLPNGKVDRRALKELSTDKTELAEDFIAPRTPTEEAIAKIWTEVLKCDRPLGGAVKRSYPEAEGNRVSVRDNFFELGGDSLLAVRLMAQIHQQFERELPLSALFLTPTIEGLASVLGQEADTLPWSPLVPIQPAGSKPPFFCIHPIFGTVFPYYQLAYCLGFDQPFYGLQPLGLDGEQPHSLALRIWRLTTSKRCVEFNRPVPIIWEAGLSEVWLLLKWLNNCFRPDIRWLYSLSLIPSHPSPATHLPLAMVSSFFSPQ
jgi:acyl carrier protein